MRFTTTKDIDVLREHGNIEAMRILNRTYSSVAAMRKRYNVKSPTKRGERESKTKFFAEDIAAFMEMRSIGMNYETIAQAVGACSSTIRSAIKRAEQTGFDVYKKRGQ